MLIGIGQLEIFAEAESKQILLGSGDIDDDDRGRTTDAWILMRWGRGGEWHDSPFHRLIDELCTAKSRRFPLD